MLFRVVWVPSRRKQPIGGKKAVTRGDDRAGQEWGQEAPHRNTAWYASKVFDHALSPGVDAVSAEAANPPENTDYAQRRSRRRQFPRVHRVFHVVVYRISFEHVINCMRANMATPSLVFTAEMKPNGTDDRGDGTFTATAPPFGVVHPSYCSAVLLGMYPKSSHHRHHQRPPLRTTNHRQSLPATPDTSVIA